MVTLLNGQEKTAVIREYQLRYALPVLIETGLYNGRGSGMAIRDLFDRYYVIDNNPENTRAAQNAGFRAITGDSAETLDVLLRLDVFGPAIFWLDAHYIGLDGEPDECPLLGELDAILAWEHAPQSVVLIDDVRMMTGAIGWPMLAEVVEKASVVWNCNTQDDILRCVPR
jgi:hypothetical protein